MVHNRKPKWNKYKKVIINSNLNKMPYLIMTETALCRIIFKKNKMNLQWNNKMK